MARLDSSIATFVGVREVWQLKETLNDIEIGKQRARKCLRDS
jgi:hypothetical protein